MQLLANLYDKAMNVGDDLTPEEKHQIHGFGSLIKGTKEIYKSTNKG